jgi:hypothetical protein
MFLTVPRSRKGVALFFKVWHSFAGYSVSDHFC